MTKQFPSPTKLLLPGLGAALSPSGLPSELARNTGSGDGELAAKRRQRVRTWEMSPTFHCSIIGTCLTTGELKQVLTKAGEAGARSLSDHSAHGLGVLTAARQDIAGKRLNKALDKRHETIIKRFARARTVEELRSMWRNSFENGDISGAYWAVLSHPIQDTDLVREVFGEVHMLSHLIGSASRLDIARLAKLEASINERDETIARQRSRLAAAAAERGELKHELQELRENLRQREATAAVNTVSSVMKEAEAPTSDHRMDELASELSKARDDLRQLQNALFEKTVQMDQLRNENRILDTLLSSATENEVARHSRWSGQTVLYVGGRRHLIDQIRNIAHRYDITFMFHDGGLEDNTSLLPGLVGQANAVVFPVDHISHTAAGMVKRLCISQEKAFIPLRTAGLGSFATLLVS